MKDLMKFKPLTVIAFCLLVLFCVNISYAQPQDYIIGNVRVQVLTPSLIRIELKGPNGFEDRETFHIINRDWPGAEVNREVSNGYVNIATADFTVKVPEASESLVGIVITDSSGSVIWEAPEYSDYTTLKCRWPEIDDAYLYDAGDKVGYGNEVLDDRFLWKFEFSDGYTQIRNKATGDYINIENNYEYVECTPVETFWHSKDWTLTDDDGFKSIKCRWPAHPNIIHIENQKGFAEHTPASTTNHDGKTVDGWWSALWGAEDSGSDFYKNNRYWLPHPEANTTAWAICDTPRYVPAEWGYGPAPEGADHYQDNGWDLTNDSKDVYVFLPGGDNKLLRKEYLDLTGRAELMPLYAFGGWDSRYYPYTQPEALAKIDRYRSEQIPLDVFVVDTDWRVGASHGYGVNTELFPDMEQFLTDAHAKNTMITFNDHPEPQADSVLNPTEVNYRNENLRSLFDIGLDFWWFDRNWHTCIIPPDGINKEVFGMYLYHSVTEDYLPDRRPMIMANFDGIDNGPIHRAPDIAAHRYTMQWTGDTYNDYDNLRQEITSTVYAGVFAPFAYLSTDLGGHNGQTTPEQYCRWVQFGSLSPVFRLHCTRGLTRDPWDYPEPCMDVVRDFVQMRMRLLPVFYSGARGNYESGEPILRRCDLDYPEYDDASDNLQYLLGKGILVAPVYSGGGNAVPAGWLTTPAGNPGISVGYYNNVDLSGIADSRTESQVNFDWGNSSPINGIGQDNFSVRMYGAVEVKSNQPVKFGITTDDGCRLWINNQLVIDQWRDQSSATYYTTQSYEPGQKYSVKIEYYEKSGNAECRLVYKTDDNGGIDRDLWLPPGTWVDSWTGQKLTGPNRISRPTPLTEMPIYVKAGTIVPLAPDMQYTNQKPWDEITLDVYPGAGNTAYQTIYEDDRMSTAYKGNAYRKTYLQASVDNGANAVSIDISAAQGMYDGALSERAWKIRLRQPLDWQGAYKVKSVKVDGKSVGFDIIKRNPDAMPFTVSGGSSDSDIIMVEVPMGSVDNAHTVNVEFEKVWDTAAIGQDQLTGSCSYPSASISLTGYGNGLLDNADSFFLACQPTADNLQNQAKLESLSSGSVSAAAGIICRADFTANSALAAMAIDKSGTLNCYLRPGAGQELLSVYSLDDVGVNTWLKMIRIDNAIKCYKSVDGVDWAFVIALNADMPENIYSGLMVYSGSKDVPVQAEFQAIELFDSLSADISGDNMVDISDLTILSQNWLNTSCHASNWCQRADINMDDSVGLLDFAFISSLW